MQKAQMLKIALCLLFSQSISRVLFKLSSILPCCCQQGLLRILRLASNHFLPEKKTGFYSNGGLVKIVLILAPGGVYSSHMSPYNRVSSYLTFPSLPRKLGGLFLLPSSLGFPSLPLASTLLCGARTFLTVTVALHAV